MQTTNIEIYSVNQNETNAIKDNILEYIFCDEIPTYLELINAKEIKSKWQLSEEFENYDYSLILEKVEEKLVEFKAHLDVLSKLRKPIDDEYATYKINDWEGDQWSELTTIQTNISKEELIEIKELADEKWDEEGGYWESVFFSLLEEKDIQFKKVDVLSINC